MVKEKEPKTIAKENEPKEKEPAITKKVLPIRRFLTLLLPVVLGALVFYFDLHTFFGQYYESKFIELSYQTNTSEEFLENIVDDLEFIFPGKRDQFSKTADICKATCPNKIDQIASFKLVQEKCRTFPVYIQDSEVDDEKLKFTTRAKVTVPCFLELKESQIPNAGLGIFTRLQLPPGILFGPYEGTRRVIPANSTEEFDYAYTWTVNDRSESESEDSTSVDGIDEKNSNWLRYVNSARFEEEQNVAAVIGNSNIYYVIFRTVQPDEELLIWYGKDYAEYLEIKVIKEYKDEWDFDKPPPKSKVLCPTCWWSYKESIENSETSNNEPVELLPKAGDENPFEPITDETPVQESIDDSEINIITTEPQVVQEKIEATTPKEKTKTEM